MDGWVLLLLLIVITDLVKSETSSFLLPKYTSGNCSSDLISVGWVQLNFKSKSGDRLALSFCEGIRSPGAGLRWPTGSYCVLRVNGLCPFSLTPHSIQTTLSSMKKGSGTIPDIIRIAQNVDMYEVNMCCSTSVQSEPSYFNLKPPFSLIRNGAKCQEIINTNVSEVALKNEESTFINLCLYQRPQVLCSACNQLCMEQGCGCYEGFRLTNNTHCTDSEEVVDASKTHHTPPLFTTQRDLIVMLISVAIVVVLLIILSVLLICCRVIICMWPCSKCSCFSPGKRRAKKDNFRNSISAPYIGDVAMDLLNRPKKNVSVLRDLPSRHSQQSASSNNTSHYNNSNHYNNTVYKESVGYDSLRSQDKQSNALTPLITPYATSDANINQVTYDLDQPTYELDQPTYEEVPPPPALDLIPDPESPVPEYKDPSDMFRSKSFDFKMTREVKRPRVASMGASIARITPILRDPIAKSSESISAIKQVT